MKTISFFLMVMLIVILFTQELQLQSTSPLIKWFLIGVCFLLAIILFGKSSNNVTPPKDFIKRASYEDKHKDHIDGSV